MPVSVIVGGQFGSEGKGKVACIWARKHDAKVVVRVGGSNSGHTVYDDHGNRHVFRHLPTAAVLSEPICVLGPGSYIEPRVLLEEIERINLTKERLIVDPNAYVVTDDHKQREAQLRLGQRLGSTLSGTGEAVVGRVRRTSADGLAKNHPCLREFTKIGPVRTFLRELLKRDQRVVIEGTQGFGLSNLQSPHYPKATSRDTTAATFVAEAGISPLDVDEVVLVIRTFPIRVAGNSGPLPAETSWETIAKEGGWPDGLKERTTVTQNIRRVAHFDPEIVRAAIDANAPTCVVLNHFDYVSHDISKNKFLNYESLSRLNTIEESIERTIDWIGIGPSEILERQSVNSISMLREIT